MIIPERSSATRTLPTFIIAGAAKSGTSSLWHYLRAHPDVFVVPAKELNFFSHDNVFRRGLDWYVSRFEEGAAMRAIGEASPSYLSSERAIERMAQFVPEVRLIVALRNPIDRSYSHYWHARYYAMERRSFREAVDQERHAPAGKKWPFYLDHSRYHPQIMTILRHFTREQLLVVLLDDMIQDPVATFQRVCRHVGVDHTIVPSSVGEVTNTYRETRVPSLVRILIRPALGGVLPLRAWLRLQRALTRNGRRPPPMEPDVRRGLAEYFAEDNAALSSWLGRDLGMWH